VGTHKRISHYHQEVLLRLVAIPLLLVWIKVDLDLLWFQQGGVCHSHPCI